MITWAVVYLMVKISDKVLSEGGSFKTKGRLIGSAIIADTLICITAIIVTGFVVTR